MDRVRLAELRADDAIRVDADLDDGQRPLLVGLHNNIGRSPRAISAAEAVAIVDDYIRRFREALDGGRVRADGASDFNTMMRLKAFLEGKADSRQEVHGMITLEDMQARHRALRAQLEALDPAVTGEVPPRERDRTRGLLADDVDGSSDDDAAMAPKRAPEKSRVRRLPAEQFDRDGAGIPVASRRRADDSVEPAPRRRVVAREREDALLDDELAQEREDVRRGDVRALRRRTREDGYDEEEFEDARVPRRARAASPTHTTAPRPRRPDRSHVPGSRTRCTRASLVAAGRTSPSSQRTASACRGGTGADVPRLVQAQTTRGVRAFAHAWHPGDGSVEPPRGAQACERDQSGNSISGRPRWRCL
jgi:hypothetical protein